MSRVSDRIEVGNFMRRIWIVLLVMIVVIIIVAIGALSFLNVNKFRPRIQAELQDKLGRSVTLGELHLHLLPFSIGVDGLSVGESPTFPSSLPFATAKEVYVSAGLFSLLRGEPQINDVTLEDPQIELIRNAAGTWNYSTLGTTSTTRINRSHRPAARLI